MNPSPAAIPERITANLPTLCRGSRAMLDCHARSFALCNRLNLRGCDIWRCVSRILTSLILAVRLVVSNCASFHVVRKVKPCYSRCRSSLTGERFGPSHCLHFVSQGITSISPPLLSQEIISPSFFVLSSLTKSAGRF